MIKVYQLLAHGRWFSPGTPASSTTKTGRHDIAESGVKHQNNQSINQNNIQRISDYEKDKNLWKQEKFEDAKWVVSCAKSKNNFWLKRSLDLH